MSQTYNLFFFGYHIVISLVAAFVSLKSGAFTKVSVTIDGVPFTLSHSTDTSEHLRLAKALIQKRYPGIAYQGHKHAGHTIGIYFPMQPFGYPTQAKSDHYSIDGVHYDLTRGAVPLPECLERAKAKVREIYGV
ncbi:hypothetical protein CCAX7_26000 [Capsulimonas corticalis]|uniref:Uncharacterized protein n=1 Tax=Capsulimonas corticalis TaxID=2219043 RepID=A0A402CVX0_9BACT|nr:hypothetical protein [Capsulimonas corticalis]BDI30549.1 hypothetical protein CCAX7_26000 [Capsulimonas corticalis]